MAHSMMPSRFSARWLLLTFGFGVDLLLCAATTSLMTASVRAAVLALSTSEC